MAKNATVTAAAGTTPATTIYLPICKDEQGYFVAGRSPRGQPNEAAALEVVNKTNADGGFVAAVEIPAS